MPLPLAALARLAGAGASVGAGEAAAARAAASARGSTWRQAMSAAGGNKSLARDMVNQKASDLREEDRQRRQERQEEARENARAMREQQQEEMRDRQRMMRMAGATMPSYMRHLVGGVVSGPAGALGASADVAGDVSAGIVGNNFRGVASGALPAPFSNILNAYGRIADAIEQRAGELAPYSSAISGATAHADVRQKYADAYEANVTGDSFAEVVDLLSQIQTDLQTALAPVKDEIAKQLADVLRVVQYMTERSGSFFETVTDVMAATRTLTEAGFYAVVLAVSGDLSGAAAAIGEGGRAVALDQQIRDRQRAEGGPDGDPFDDLWRNPLLQLPPEANGVQAAQEIQQQRRFGLGGL